MANAKTDLDMSRYQPLDRDKLLKSVETLIREDGAHAVSIRNVAAKCGVSKGGIQSNFGTVDGLIDALFEKWGKEMDALTQQIRAQSAGTLSEVRIFLRASREFHFSNPERNAALMILMTQTPERRDYARQWLRDRLGMIDPMSDQARDERLYFIICEALLVVKSVQITDLSDQEWRDVFDDLDRLFDR